MRIKKVVGSWRYMYSKSCFRHFTELDFILDLMVHNDPTLTSKIVKYMIIMVW